MDNKKDKENIGARDVKRNRAIARPELQRAEEKKAQERKNWVMKETAQMIKRSI